MPCVTKTPILLLNNYYFVFDSTLNDWISNEAIYPFSDPIFC